MLLPNRILEDASNQPNVSTAYNLSGTAVTGFRTFASQLSNGDTVVVLAEEVDSNGNPAGAWELVLCSFVAGTPNTLTRDTLIESSSGSLIDWSTVGSTPRLSIVNWDQNTPRVVAHVDQTTAVTSIDITDVFRAGNDYMVLLDGVIGDATDPTLYMRVRESGSWVTTGYTTTGRALVGGSFYTINSKAAAQIQASATGVDSADIGVHGQVLLFDPAATQFRMTLGPLFCDQFAAPETYGGGTYQGTAIRDGGSGIDGLRFYMSSGNIKGEITVWELPRGGF